MGEVDWEPGNLTPRIQEVAAAAAAVPTPPSRFVVSGVDVDRWQGAVMRARQPNTRAQLALEIRGAGGTVRRQSSTAPAASFRFDPYGKNFVVEGVHDSELEAAVRTWLGY